MLKNAALDIGVGSIPVVGDVFDLGFHANRRNLSLLEDFLRSRSRRESASKLSAGIAFGLLGLVMLLAIIGVIGFVVWLWRELH